MKISMSRIQPGPSDSYTGLRVEQMLRQAPYAEEASTMEIWSSIWTRFSYELREESRELPPGLKNC